MDHKVEYQAALQLLKASTQEFIKLFEHGSLEVELYKPDQIDRQTPHEKDEVYIIATGKGKFLLEDKTTAVQRGDFLFVPARAHHQFIEFSSDFSTWVLFYGPKEGEDGPMKNFVP
jgi:mannose-6-phosphate isomerase-like protein (cupin superfamily)